MPTSPNIDRIAQEGTLLEDAYSCSNVTDSSLTTIFSGKYPTSHGILSHGSRVKKGNIRKLQKRRIRFLPEFLKANGYTTLAVDFLGRWHKRGYDCYSGFLHQANPIEFPVSQIDRRLTVTSRRYARMKKASTIDDAHLIASRANDLIRKYQDRKFFLFLHFWDTHMPYGPPLSFYEKLADEDENMFSKKIGILLELLRRNYFGNKIIQEEILRYDASISFVDYEIGRLVEKLKGYELLDQTWIIITGDHGESFSEHNIYFSHNGLYDTCIHVPLIFRYPVFPKRRVKGFIQHFDLVPTILDFLGLKNGDFDGKSALPLILDESKRLHLEVYAEEAYYQRKRAVRTTEYKYIRALSKEGAVCKKCGRIHGGGVEELYDLNNDLGEVRNIIAEKRDLADKLKEKLTSFP